MKVTNTPLAVIAVGLTVVATSFIATPSQAASCSRLIEMSHQLEALTQELNDEFRLHYSHTGLFHHLNADALKIRQEAAHTRRLAHNSHGNVHHLAVDLKELDQLSHHLHELVDAGDTGRYGHVNGSTRHVHEHLESLTHQIHALEARLTELRTPRHIEAYTSHHFQTPRDSHGVHHGHEDSRARSHTPASPFSNNARVQKSIQFGNNRLWFSFR